MKNHELRGIGTVYRYTVQQHYKTPSVLIFLLILFVLSVASLPLIGLFSGGQKQDVTETKITQLYLRNETGFPLDAADITADELYKNLNITETEEDDKTIAKRLTQEKNAACSVIAMDEKTMIFNIKTSYGEEGAVSGSDAGTLNGILREALHKSLLRSLSVTEAQEALIHCKTSSQVSKISDFLRGAEESSTGTHVFANVFYCVFIMMITSLSMSYIFQLCMEEKVSKLVESLLVSVAPTALLIGKILAATTFIFGGLGLCGVGIAVSYQIAKQMVDVTIMQEALQKLLSFDISKLHLDIRALVLFAVCLLLAYSIAAGLSGIVGSCCSKTEDIQQASLVVMLFLMTGYLAGALAPMFESDALNIFCSLFPFTSIFTAFPNYVCGKIGLPVFAAGLALQAATAFLFARIAGAVYRMMLLYRGNYPKPKQVIQMLRENSASAKRAAGKEKHHAE